jgi:hypothetical protein
MDDGSKEEANTLKPAEKEEKITMKSSISS